LPLTKKYVSRIFEPLRHAVPVAWPAKMRPTLGCRPCLAGSWCNRDFSPTTANEGLEYQRRLGVYTFMIRQFAFRRILPVLLLLIHLTLFWWVWTQERHRSVESHPPMMFDVPPKPFSIALKASIVLNLPALLMSIPIRMFFSTTSDTSTFLASLPFVPLVWYGIGLWLDRLIGNVALPRNPHPTRRRIAAKTAAIFLCLGIMTISPIGLKRTFVSQFSDTAP
jgi:hypothetical protein